MNSSPARDRAAETPALECRRLSVGYDARIVLDGVDFAVAPGESLAVLGPSGSGKTTLLYAIAGGLRTPEGPILGTLVVRVLWEWTLRRLGGFESLIIIGLLLALIVTFLPRGIYPLVARGASALSARLALGSR